VFGIGSKLKTPEIAVPTTEEVTAKTPASSKIKETEQTASSSREILNTLSKPTEESNLALPQTTEPSSGISLKEAPKSLQKALKFLPEKAREELTVFKVDENKYQISFDGPSSQNFFLGGLKGVMHTLNPLKSLIPDEAKALLKQSDRAQDLMPLLKQDKVHMQALFEANEKTTKLIDLSLTDSPYGLLKDIFEGKNNEMKKLLTETINQILPEANAKTKKSEMPEINLSDTDKAAFLSLQEALKEKKPEAALEKAKPVIDVMARTYGLETLNSNPNAVKLEEALEISINTLVDKNRPKEGGNTTIFAKGHSSQEKFTAPKLEINGFIPEKNEFKPGIITVINDSPNINLPLATLLTTLEMAHFANGGKLPKTLGSELVKAALANTKNAAEIAANSQAKAAVAEMN
jgi:hypothetical protein